MKNNHKFGQGTMSKIVTKELEVKKNAQNENEVDEVKIRPHVMSLLKKDMPSSRNGTAITSASSLTSDATQEIVSTPAL